ncbi:MAG: leucyl aminopeptidase family protein [Bdellovibrionaceae bacterium]|nr:leucyl aminopeptidase family protein [Pseudobdellovibrionaceae bacterium]MDW8191043.1 leucyl aminopeptidase family protein [Pseudobdellovibrionaceae bacterium]
MVHKIPTYLDSHVVTVAKKVKPTHLALLAKAKDRGLVVKHLKSLNLSEKDLNKVGDHQFFKGRFFDKDHNSVWVLIEPEPAKEVSHYGLLEESSFTFWKGAGGLLLESFSEKGIKNKVLLHSWGLEDEDWLAFFLGLELKAYQFLPIYTGGIKEGGLGTLPEWHLVTPPSQIRNIIQESLNWGLGQNLARHLVNLPAKDCYPEAVIHYVYAYFKNFPHIKIRVLNEKQMEKEGMELALAVGRSGQYPPRFLHIEYHPPQVRSFGEMSSFALVGKGVTFDSGGLDLKPSSAMRLMKKDMAGAAAVIGSIYYLAAQQLPVRVSGYMALGENAVDQNSMRPGDVFRSRQGFWVEIHNTDAEGRLLLADSIDYAVTRRQRPDVLIDLATLTGGIKTTLGLEIAGLFSNHDRLAQAILSACQKSGELAWRIPLYNKYTAQFSTPFADFVNAVDGWASPITAALFLEKFVQKVPWVHLDIYGWSDKVQPWEAHVGGNGQGVGLLNMFFRSFAPSGGASFK